VMKGNTVGLNAAGSASVGNPWDGVVIAGNNNIVGGPVAGDGNVISGHNPSASGIAVFSTATGIVIQGNTVGLNMARSAAIGNGHGVWFQAGTAASNSTVGGTAAGAANVISGNAMAGVAVIGSTAQVAIRGNSIYGNTGSGIDLSAAANTGDGITANDGTKTINQPNLLMDSPVFTSASLNGTMLTVAGYVGNAAGQSAFANSRVEVFVSDTSSTNGSGQTYLGFVTADASGNFNSSFTLPGGVT